MLPNDLKPCAGCGSGDLNDPHEGMDDPYYAVRCVPCGLRTRRCNTSHEAREAWNRRADDGYLRGLEWAADLCDRSYGSDNKADRSPRHLARAIRAEIDRARREAANG